MKSALKLAGYTSIWDQTIGCNKCGQAWWMENATPDITMFHKSTCPLYGRRDVAQYYCNLEYHESLRDLGHKCGLPYPPAIARERRAAHLERKRRRKGRK